MSSNYRNRSSKKPQPKKPSSEPKPVPAQKSPSEKMKGYEREQRHPSGREWNRKKANVISYYGGICGQCDHPGATQVDHVKAYAEGGDDSVGNLRPVHGSSGSQKNPCPVCKLNCNQIRGSLSFEGGRAKIARRQSITPVVKDKDAAREW